MTSSHPLRIGLKLSQGAPIESYRRIWQIADEAHFDHCWAFDHLAVMAGNEEDRTIFEGWTLLGGMAVATKRTRIGLLVSGMAYRHPALLAKAAVTVDHLSEGRLELGIGAGWAATEHQMFGIGQPGTQVDRFTEGLEVMKRLWTQDRSDFDGRFFHLSNAVGNPKPNQRPYPPIWIGAAGPKMLRVAAEHADVWNSAVAGLEAAVETGERLAAACQAIDRDPAEIRWSGQVDCDGSDPEATVAELGRWWEAGFSELILYCRGSDPVRSAEVAAQEIVPRMRSAASAV